MSKLRPWLLDLLDPGHERRGALRFGPSEEIRFDVHRLFSSDRIKAELRRIGEMEEKLRRENAAKTKGV